ncbi:MAG: crossover junction endodeoxyribonuclease RuvC [Candidatus Omnitrophota bacterium]|nr:MAG: crossover junction endodeoxyribonuclease RuvC [Candidatus Omnitrophota bacterium]
MIILGVDPGLNVTGYGVIEASASKSFPFRRVKLKEAGIIRTKARDAISGRLEKIHGSISNIVEEYRPGVLVLEKLYSHYKHPVTSILMGHARGAVCLVAGTSKVKLVSFPSTRIRKAVTGNGHASKQQIQRMIQGLLGLKEKPRPMDVSDALACALAYVNVELR